MDTSNEARQVAEFALESLVVAGQLANKKLDEGNVQSALTLTNAVVETVENLSRETLENIILIAVLTR